MDKRSKHINQYSAVDIERYHSGQMSKQEMHLLEKAALDDPFLADALEGYAYTQSAQTDLIELKEKLFGGGEKAKVVSIKRTNVLWYKIAAAVVVFAVGGWLVFKVIEPSPAIDIAQKTEAIKSTPTHEQDKPESKLQDSVVNNQVQSPAIIESNTNATSTDNVVITNNSNQKDQKQTSIPNNTASRRNDIAITDTNYYRNNASRDVRSSNISSGPSQPRANFYNGRVVDPNNNALPNATVVMDNNVAIKTDKGGNFVLPANDSTQDATVLAKGYSSNRATLNTNEPIVIVMKPLSNPVIMEEVVINKKERADKKYTARNTIVADTLEPTVGWTAYDDYIAEKLKQEEDPVLKETHGEVLLSFEVNSKGEPVNITVQKSLCDKCDEKAIEILKNGPKWKKRKNKKGQVSIRF